MSALFFAFALSAAAETKIMTLREALTMALAQNPDVLLARLDQQKARDQITIAKDPFLPKVYGGSGLAWSTGYPSSIDGNAPSIFEAKTQMALFDRPQSYKVAQAHEELKTAEIDVGRRQDEVVYRVASLFLDVEQAAQSLDAAQRQSSSLARVRELIDARVAEGRMLPVESRRADLNVKKARYKVDALAADLINAETSLALALGLGPDDRVRPAKEERAPLAMPASEEASIEEALEHSPELRRIESNMQVKTLDIKGFRAMRLPRVNVVAQYSLFAKYAYQNYFGSFQRNNAQLGASFEVPLLVGRASNAYASQAEADVARLRVEFSRTRSRITADLRRAFADVKRIESFRDVAFADLELAREELSVFLAQREEGKLLLAQVEVARAAEDEKWQAYYEALHAAERARLNVLRQMGTLLAALKP